MEEMLLILDLDETLVLGREEPLGRPADFTCGEYLMYKRPGVHEFVDGIRDSFEIAVWSSATEDYVRCVVSELFGPGYPLSFVWSRDRCTRRVDQGTRELYYLKDFKKIHRKGYTLERVLMIDDDARALSRSYGNLIRVASFTGDSADTELYALLFYLHSLPHVQDVRTLDKRGWKKRPFEPGTG